MREARTTKKISKDMKELSNTINQQDLIDIYRTLYSTTAGYIFFSSAHKTYTKRDHILGHKTKSIFFLRIEIK